MYTAILVNSSTETGLSSNVLLTKPAPVLGTELERHHMSELVLQELSELVLRKLSKLVLQELSELVLQELSELVLH